MTNDQAPHVFDQAVRLKAQGNGRFDGLITPAYNNMVGPYGGMIAAVMLNAVLSHPERQGDPVALTVNFAGPMKANGEGAGFVVAARVARTNRSNQHWIVELEQDGVTAVTATALLASRRPTWQATEARPPQVPRADALPVFRSKALPPWVSHYELRFAAGELTLDGVERPDSVSTLWARDMPPRPLDFLSLTALSDVFFPRHMVRRQIWSPAGTVSVTFYFHADAAALARQGTAPLLATARASRFHDLFFDQSAQLWGRDDSLLVVTHQLVYYRDAEPGSAANAKRWVP